ncbi:carnitine 3-dehydrogenase, partial [Enterococcus hirae]
GWGVGVFFNVYIVWFDGVGFFKVGSGLLCFLDVCVILEWIDYNGYMIEYCYFDAFG